MAPRPRRGAATPPDRRAPPRRRLPAHATLLALLFAAAPPPRASVRGAVWTNGPEDGFFCGWSWDQEDCLSRQHCPSGLSEDCEGADEGVKCFANSGCDTRHGHGDAFVSSGGSAPPRPAPTTPRPTFGDASDDPADYYWCGVGIDDARENCGSFDRYCPSGTSSECPQGNICYHDM